MALVNPLLNKKSAKTTDENVLPSGVHATRRYEFADLDGYFQKDTPVLQGRDFPLQETTFKQENIKIEDGEGVGASGRGVDARNVSYPIGE